MGTGMAALDWGGGNCPLLFLWCNFFLLVVRVVSRYIQLHSCVANYAAQILVHFVPKNEYIVSSQVLCHQVFWLTKQCYVNMTACMHNINTFLKYKPVHDKRLQLFFIIEKKLL